VGRFDMKNKYDIVVFDLDGTLLDTTEGVIAAVKYTIKEMNFKMLDNEMLSTFIGPPIQNSFAKAYGLEGEILQEIATIFRQRYKNFELLKAVPYDGIFELLERLKRRKIIVAVATYKREDYAITLLNHFGFTNYTDIIHGADHGNRLKKEDIIMQCIQEAGVKDNNRVLMVGDTIYDAEGAEKIKLDFLGVLYGFGFKGNGDLSSITNIGAVKNPLEIIGFV